MQPVLIQLAQRLFQLLDLFIWCILFVLIDAATTEIYTLSLHDALPISLLTQTNLANGSITGMIEPDEKLLKRTRDRKSTRLNSSHVSISYAVFCLKKKTRAMLRTYRLKVTVS